MLPPEMHDIHYIKAPLKRKEFQTKDKLIHDYEAVIREVDKMKDLIRITMLPGR